MGNMRGSDEFGMKSQGIRYAIEQQIDKKVHEFYGAWQKLYRLAWCYKKYILLL
jgi:hypothetical protein